MNNTKTEPIEGAIFSTNMLVGVESGDYYSEKEIRAWLTIAGFIEIKKPDMDSGKGQIIGIKK